MVLSSQTFGRTPAGGRSGRTRSRGLSAVAADLDGQLQRFFEAQPPKLPGGRLSNDEVAVPECSAKDRARMPL